MKELLFFSHNQKKIEEINKIFMSNKVMVKNLNNFMKTKEPKETGKTFSANAKIKSAYGQKIFNIPCFADDSGFCVEALNDGPGVMSKRFLEKFTSTNKAFDYIIKNVKAKNNNKASFVTAISFTINSNHHVIFIGRINGSISMKPRGKNGFGYDPIFIPENHEKTFAEMSLGEKNKISHRGIAATKLKSFLF